MISASSFPEQRYAIAKTKLRREITLPDGVNGTVMGAPGQKVDGNTIVARGFPPVEHHVLPAAEILRVGRRQTLEEFLLVEVGDTVEEDQAVASKRKDPERGRRVYSPVNGIVVGIDDARIVIREIAEEIEIIAGIPGEIVDTAPGRSVTVEVAGAVVQGVWGNGRRAVGALKMEPDDGMEFIEGGAINLDWRGSIVITKRPLTTTNFVIMEEQNISGVIAPSMDSTLLDIVSGMDRAVMLTEGFGDEGMSNALFNMLEKCIEDNFNVRATLDAVVPAAGSRRPEAIINVAMKGARPKMLQPTRSLKEGTRVRITREPYSGQTGTIRELSTVPLLLGNGLRVSAAVVEVPGGERVAIPLADLELFEV